MGKKIGTYLLIGLGFFLAVSLVRNILKISEVKKRVEKIRSRVAKLEEENQELEGRVGETKSQEYLEKQLRDKLGLTKEGETVVVLPDAETLKKLVLEIPQEEETLPDPNWKRWARLFGL